MAQSLGVPVALAAELMEGAERSGHLCRDEGGTGGLVFYANAFPTLRYKRGQGAAVLAKS